MTAGGSWGWVSLDQVSIDLVGADRRILLESNVLEFGGLGARALGVGARAALTGVRNPSQAHVQADFLPDMLPGIEPSGRPGGSARKPLRVKGVGDRLAYPWVRSVPLLTFVDPSTPLR
jgi:hypothetical protein